jgi:hypothetical protein
MLKIRRITKNISKLLKISAQVRRYRRLNKACLENTRRADNLLTRLSVATTRRYERWEQAMNIKDVYQPLLNATPAIHDHQNRVILWKGQKL